MEPLGILGSAAAGVTLTQVSDANGKRAWPDITALMGTVQGADIPMSAPGLILTWGVRGRMLSAPRFPTGASQGGPAILEEPRGPLAPGGAPETGAHFTDTAMPAGFCDDWVKAADEESKHFNLIRDCLEDMDSHYGALPAHDGMWRAAEDTAHDLMGRLAVVPMVLEARGRDVTPGMIDVIARAGETRAVEAMQVIYSEEVHHVAYGSKWFHFLCGRHDLDPKLAFHDLVRRYFHGLLKPPFNEEKRAEAGLPPDFYWPLAAVAAT